MHIEYKSGDNPFKDKKNVLNARQIAKKRRLMKFIKKKNMNNHQNAIFYQLDNFMKHSHSFTMTIFHKITKSAKLVILLIIPTDAKVSPFTKRT
jgi:hypothetical protein